MSEINFQDSHIAFKHLSDSELIKAKWVFKVMENPNVVSLGSNLLLAALKINLPIDFILKKTILPQFCGGESLEECLIKSKSLRDRGLGICLHYAAEESKNEVLMNNCLQHSLDAISQSEQLRNKIMPYPFVAIKLSGIIRSSLLKKLQQNIPLQKNEKKEFNNFKHRLNQLCDYSNQYNTSLLIDAEESWIQKSIDKTLMEFMEKYNKERAVVYTTIQMYKKDSLSFLKQSIKIADEKKYFLGVKLVRGAYLEEENYQAKKNNYSSPIHTSKEKTDRDFNLALKLCLQNNDRIYLMSGTHNENSSHLFSKLLPKDSQNIKDGKVITAQLLGMSDNLTYNLLHHGYPACKYLPFAKANKMLSFLIRRAQENTAILGEANRELQLICNELNSRNVSIRKDLIYKLAK